jgi:hypothetical protein
MGNDYYYNNGLQITSEEAHKLTDKSGLVVAGRLVNLTTEFKGTKRGLAQDYDLNIDKAVNQ